jgi:hypothetical protein
MSDHHHKDTLYVTGTTRAAEENLEEIQGVQESAPAAANETMEQRLIREMYEANESIIKEIITQVATQKEKAVPFVILEVTTLLVPNLMKTVGTFSFLQGSEKKRLVIETIKFTITKVFDELNKFTNLSQEDWDEHVEQVLLLTVPALIENMLAVEKGKLKFSPEKSWLRFFMCFGGK